MIYFDNGSTTTIFPQALDAYVKTCERIFANPSSLHELGDVAHRLLNQARRQIAKLLGVGASEIYFTSGGTEGDNWVLKGTAIERRNFGEHIIVSSVEHPAVLETAKQLTGLGFAVDYAPVDKLGQVKIDDFEQLLRKGTILVSTMAVNNEIGVIQPINKIAQILEDYPSIHFHVDAVQALGKIEKKLYLPQRVDFATFSAHKCHGPRGIGFLYCKKGKQIAPLLTGGGQELNQRSGTENLPAIVAMAKSLRIYLTDREEKMQYVLKLRNMLLCALAEYQKVHIFTKNSADFALHIVTFGIAHVRGEVLVRAFAEKQIYVSTTGACSSRKKLPGQTLLAMKTPAELAETAIRISLDESNTEVEVAKFLDVFKSLYEKFSKIN